MSKIRDDLEASPLHRKCKSCDGKGGFATGPRIGPEEWARSEECPWCDGAGYVPICCGECGAKRARIDEGYDDGDMWHCPRCVAEAKDADLLHDARLKILAETQPPNMRDIVLECLRPASTRQEPSPADALATLTPDSLVVDDRRIP